MRYACILDVILHSFYRNKFQQSLPGKWRPILACDIVTLTGELHSKSMMIGESMKNTGFFTPCFLTSMLSATEKCHFGCDKSSLR